jgi:glyoxylase-like metal-dependent hydrolase (beta-lactamase superfamily II)
MSSSKSDPAATQQHLIDRRTLLTDFGKGIVGVALFGGVALRPALAQSATTPPWKWAQANLGFVSAYILSRGKQAVVVDTGVAGSSAAILKAAKTLGVGWDGVRHVVLTHSHPDHAGSIADIMKKAPKARAYAGAADVPNVRAPRAIKAVKDGDDVFGLQVIATPGHTPGSIAIYEPTLGLMVSGDALVTSGNEAAPPNSQYTKDMDEAMRSLSKIAAKPFEILLPGHGDPLLSGGSASVAKLI